MTDPRNERGMQIRREVLGDDHVDAAIARTTEFTAEFQELITRYAWGEICARPGLDRRTRSAITLTALVAAGRPACRASRADQRDWRICLISSRVSAIGPRWSIFSGLTTEQIVRTFPSTMSSESTPTFLPSGPSRAAPG